MPRTLGSIHRELNRACEEILDAADLRGTPTEDAMNLLVNAAISYLERSAKTLEQVAHNDYGEDLDTVVGWISRYPERVNDDEPGPVSVVADAANAIPAPLPDFPTDGRKHRPHCKVWTFGECTCHEDVPKDWLKGGGSGG
jgi:hypothetical protein